MTTIAPRSTATILAFPLQRVRRPVRDVRPPAGAPVAVDAWYHQAAIQEERGRKG